MSDPRTRSKPEQALREVIKAIFAGEKKVIGPSPRLVYSQQFSEAFLNYLREALDDLQGRLWQPFSTMPRDEGKQFMLRVRTSDSTKSGKAVVEVEWFEGNLYPSYLDYNIDRGDAITAKMLDGAEWSPLEPEGRTEMGLLMLVSEIRAAVGDPYGTMMQDELVAECKRLHEFYEADKLRNPLP